MYQYSNDKLMQHTIPFIKAQGLGNDFMMIDITNLPQYNWHGLASHLSDRRLGIGFDQLILFKDHTVWFYNADGSSAESCGNGTRCLAYYLMSKKNTHSINIETPGGQVSCLLNPDKTVTVQMPSPSVVEKQGLVAHADLFKQTPIYVRVGNPHLVCFVDVLDDINEYGPILSRQDVNVGFARIINDQKIELKVWERGTGLTPACGSGACASVIASRALNLVGEKVIVEQEGGSLQIQWDQNQVLMTGAATIVYEGVIDIAEQKWAF
jgi:diaminopimelate epimerase